MIEEVEGWAFNQGGQLFDHLVSKAGAYLRGALNRSITVSQFTYNISVEGLNLKLFDYTLGS